MNNRETILQEKPNKQIREYIYSSKAILGRGSYGTVILGKNKETSNRLNQFIFRIISGY